MDSRIIVFLLAILLLTCPFTASAPSAASSPARLVNGLFSNANSMLLKWAKSLKSTTKTAISGRPMMKFESGYTVETVFDGSKLGIEPYSLELLPNGEMLILDSANSNLYKISSSLSLYSRPKLVAGSSEGYAGHIDGRLREARLNHPKGVTVDDRGNIYIADTDNMAIRKIGDAGMTTIAGGKKTRSGSHVDGPSEDAKFSNDFDVVYIGSSCSLLVIDRGNQAIREIQLHFDDCAYQYGSGFPLGVAVLIAAGFFGYMLALLQRRVGTMVSSKNDDDQVMVKTGSQSSVSKPLMRSQVRPPLIPVEGEEERQDEESFLNSLGGLLGQTAASALEILKGLFPWLQTKSLASRDHQFQEQQYQQQQQQQKYSNTWPAQDSYVIRDEDEPPSVEARTPTPRKTYAFMSKDPEKMQQLRQSRAFYSGGGGGREGNSQQQQQQQQQPTLQATQKQQQQPTQQTTQKQQHRHQYHSSIPETCYEQRNENASEIVFGAVQQERKHEAMVIKPLDYENDSAYIRHLNRYRVNSMAAYNGPLN